MTRGRADVDHAPIRTVRISDPDEPGLHLTLRLRWLCPVPICRRPRGEPRVEMHPHHNAAGNVIARTWPHVWELPCRHVRLTRELLAEAAALAAERGTHDRAAVPRPRNPEDTQP